MSMKTLERLREQRQRIVARIRSLRKQGRALERQRQERVARLVGKVVVARVKAGTLAWPEVKAWLDEGLTAAREREVFDLPLEPPQVRAVCAGCRSAAQGSEPAPGDRSLHLVQELHG